MEFETKLISACGKEIFVTEEVKVHLLAHPDVLEFLEEAVKKIRIPDDTVHFCDAVNFGRIIGTSLLIKTNQISPKDETDFSFRLERKWPSRVTLEESGKPCDFVTLEIKLDKRLRKYILSTAYIGFPCPYEPCYIKDQESDEFQKALNFWCSHALAYDPKIMGKTFKSSWDSTLNRNGTA